MPKLSLGPRIAAQNLLNPALARDHTPLLERTRWRAAPRSVAGLSLLGMGGSSGKPCFAATLNELHGERKNMGIKRILFALGSALAVSVASAQMGNMSMEQSMSALKQASGKTFDIYWMSQMIAHHGGAVDMARAALKDGKDARVKKAAQGIITAQNAEIKQLEGWLKTWYNTKPDARQMALMRADMEPMMTMSVGGMAGMTHGDPDKNFLEAMIPHHQSAVDMSKLALTKAAKPELKVFAQKVIKDQTAEIKQYQAWLKTMK